MSKDKGILAGGEHEEVQSKARSAEKSESVENPLADEQFTNRLVFSSTWHDEKELLENSLDYQVIESLYEEIRNSDDLTFQEMKRKALNIIDDKFESFRRVFDLPTELIAMPVKCKEGIFYLSVNPRGYLCFYKDITVPVNKRLALYLVRSEDGAKKRMKN